MDLLREEFSTYRKRTDGGSEVQRLGLQWNNASGRDWSGTFYVDEGRRCRRTEYKETS